MDKVYLKILKSRFEYFQNKKIIELTDYEIQEFVNLKKEIAVQLSEVTNVIYDVVKKVSEPYVEAQIKYNKRVINK